MQLRRYLPKIATFLSLLNSFIGETCARSVVYLPENTVLFDLMERKVGELLADLLRLDLIALLDF